VDEDDDKTFDVVEKFGKGAAKVSLAGCVIDGGLSSCRSSMGI
jgi:hypothetical protein